MPQRRGVTLYRGRAEGLATVRGAYPIGQLAWWVGFTSASTDIAAAGHMAGYASGTILELQCQEVTDLAGCSFFPDEQEFLMAPNTQWIPNGETKIADVQDTECAIHMCTVIPLLQVRHGSETVS